MPIQAWFVLMHFSVKPRTWAHKSTVNSIKVHFWIEYYKNGVPPQRGVGRQERLNSTCSSELPKLWNLI